MLVFILLVALVEGPVFLHGFFSFSTVLLHAQEKEIEALKKKIENLGCRKNNVEDKWFDGEWDKERYHEALEPIEKELLQAGNTWANWKKRKIPKKLALPDIAKLMKFDRLDRELVLLLVNRSEVQENGKVTIVYNFTVYRLFFIWSLCRHGIY
jgi:hypothetical protein